MNMAEPFWDEVSRMLTFLPLRSKCSKYFSAVESISLGNWFWMNRVIIDDFPTPSKHKTAILGRIDIQNPLGK